ncbi:MAG: VWA domain-containing protein [Bacteroidales bacterium]|nr:VWA domain-containing protein [Bacteroidales bacterium]
MYLIGYYNPYHCYPSKIIPIIINEDKLFAVYRYKETPEYLEIKDSVQFIKLNDDQLFKYDKIDLSNYSFFAFSLNDIIYYKTDYELLEILLQTKKYINYNPFLLLNLSQSTGDKFLNQYAFRKCIIQLIGVNEKFTYKWYNENYKLNNNTINLPVSLDEYKENIRLIKIGCSIDKVEFISELNNYINSDNSFFKEFNTQLITYGCTNSELELAFLNRVFDIVIPESIDFFKIDESFVINNEKYNNLGSSRIILIQKSRNLNLNSSPDEAIRHFFENFLFNKEFSFIRPRSDTQFGMLIDSFILEYIDKYLHNNITNDIEEIIELSEKKVKRYFNSDQELLEYFKIEDNWEIDSFFIKKSFLNEFLDIIPNDFAPIIIELDERYTIDIELYVSNQNISYYNIPERFQEILVDNDYLTKAYNVDLPLSAIFVNERLTLLNKYSGFGYNTLQKPLSIYLVVDTSGSMSGDKIDSVKDAIRTFIALLNSERGDKLGIISFNNFPTIVSPIDFITNREDSILRSVRDIVASGGTALLDAINLSIDSHLEFLDDGIKLIIVLTDGLERHSRTTTYDKLINKIRALSTNINMFGFAYGQDADLGYLEAISKLTGGYAKEGTISNIKQLFSYIARHS